MAAKRLSSRCLGQDFGNEFVTVKPKQFDDGRGIYDRVAFRPFSIKRLCGKQIPDDTTILTFWHLLDRNVLTGAIFTDTNTHLNSRGPPIRHS